MIISGGSRSNWKFFAQHLVKTTENERVEVAEIRGLAADTVREAFREMAAVASGTRCRNFFYHANLNPRAGETLSTEQWGRAVDLLETHLGLEGQARFVVEHTKDGRTHRHVVWSRIDIDSMTARPDGMNYAAHERTARVLETEFDLAPVLGVHGREPDQERPERRAENWEVFRSKERGQDPAEVKAHVSQFWELADSGRAFAAALAQGGYQLCRGDRRDFVVLDRGGEVHSLARRLPRVKAAQVRAKLADLDPAALPSIEEGRARLQDQPLREEARTAPPVEPEVIVAPVPAPEREPATLTALDRFAQRVSQTMASNGGNPQHADGMTWLDRSIAVLGQAVEWAASRWRDLVGHLHERHRGHDHEPDR